MPSVATDHPSWLWPAVSLIYAAAISLVVLSADQLSQYLPGNWFNLLGAAVLTIAVLSLVLLVRLAWRRHREGLEGRALGLGGTAIAALLLGVLAVIGLVENAQIASVISGADVHLTRPVMDSLPRPPGTRLLDETPGLADTESISEDLSATDLKSIVPFYERELVKRGWVEDATSATTPIVRFTKGDYVLSVAIDPPSSGYTLTVDRVTHTPSPSASAAASGTVGPSASPGG